MEKVAVYCRVSTEEQKEKQSIETQIEYAKDYCRKEDYIPYEFYCDDGVSGTIPFNEREAGTRLLIHAQEERFKTVLVYKIDRIGRDNLVTLEAAYKLNKLGIEIKSMTELSDRSNPQGRFMFNLFASLAEWEKEQIRERTIDGKYRKARSGKFPGGIIPYGYYLDDDKYLQIDVNPIPGFAFSTADVVKKVFNWMALDGTSTISIAKRLNELGIPATKSYGKIGSANGKWRHDRIRKMIISTLYIGSYNYGKTKSRKDNRQDEVSISVPPIIDKALWLNAQKTLKSNRKFSRRNTKRPFLLRGLIKCNFCGHGYIGYENARKVHYYRCYGKIGHYKMVYGECIGSAKMVRRDWIEGVVWNEIKNWILHPSVIEELISSKLKRSEKEKGNSFKIHSKLVDSIDKKKEERSRILDLYRKNLISMEEVQEQLRAVESEENALVEMAGEVKANIIDGASYEELQEHFRKEINSYREMLNKENIIFEDKQKLVQNFVKEVRVNWNGRKAGSPNLIETIPFRKNVETIPSKDAKITTVYSRDKNPNKDMELQINKTSNFAEVIYQFPISPESIGVIVNSSPRRSRLRLDPQPLYQAHHACS